MPIDHTLEYENLSVRNRGHKAPLKELKTPYSTKYPLLVITLGLFFFFLNPSISLLGLMLLGPPVLVFLIMRSPPDPWKELLHRKLPLYAVYLTCFGLFIWSLESLGAVIVPFGGVILVVPVVLFLILYFLSKGSRQEALGRSLEGVRARPRNKLIILGGLAFLLFFNSAIPIAAGKEKNEPVLEDLIASRVKELYRETLGAGGFTAGGTNDPNWQDTFYALETQQRLNASSLLSPLEKQHINAFIMRQRVDEYHYTTEVVNTTETVNGTEITKSEEVMVENTRTIDWWGTIRKSIEALHMLDLIDGLSPELVTAVKNRVFNHYASTGLNWQVDSAQWEDTYWGILQAAEYNLYSPFSELGLTPILNSDSLLTENSSMEKFEHAILANQTRSIRWADTMSFPGSQWIETNTDGYFGSPLSFKRVSDVFPSLEDNYLPYQEIMVDWGSLWSDKEDPSSFVLPNYESWEFANLSGSITPVISFVEDVITAPNGSTVTQLFTTTTEVWNPYDLDYQLNLIIYSL
ncbi:MAG: hypothetical protein ACFFFG_18310 [Candidatus Thorarchaeota archaeon]